MTRVKISENNFFTLLSRASIALTILLALIASSFTSPRFSAGILAGGLLAVANFYWLRNILQRALLLQVEDAPRFAILRYVVRLALLAVALLLLVIYAKVDIFGLLIGLSVLVVNIIALSIYLSLKGG
ncbi:ATP synthase-associated magnesium import membrane protein AtpI [Geotalea daltonii FRC-32]|uniref:ATP synthase-associated magnesium import membrane protein AtpI n=1 Tax=Geotalea daltonii (strain DSM 22248 / JCM 15807 / FRC-32) TaxID=316067 RepID=B9LZL4_GEODF|nr:ATP synthase subunit I [Geotalea daltonii]ACM18828.1 ATP synthase-associated magnesium import membrane protein AtpI [Geotalea daltonii FRC-32]